jgi:hypothetical protein
LGYVAAVACHSFLPGVFYFLMFRSVAKKLNIFWLVIVGALLLTNGVSSGHKSLLVMFLIGAYIAFQIGWLKGRIRVFSAGNITLLACTVLLVTYLYTAQYKGTSFTEALEMTWYRSALEPNRGLQLYFYVYPNIIGHLFGASSRVISAILGIEATPPHTAIPLEVFGQHGTGWNVVFIGDAWADFGWFGVLGSSLVTGLLLQYYNITFDRVRPTAWSKAVQASLVVFSAKLAQVSLLTSLLTFGVGLIVIIYLLTRRMVWRDGIQEGS